MFSLNYSKYFAVWCFHNDCNQYNIYYLCASIRRIWTYDPLCGGWFISLIFNSSFYFLFSLLCLLFCINHAEIVFSLSYWWVYSNCLFCRWSSSTPLWLNVVIPIVLSKVSTLSSPPCCCRSLTWSHFFFKISHT